MNEESPLILPMEEGPKERLREERRRRGWSQLEVAVRLADAAADLGEPEVGVDGHMVGRWERGVRRPCARYIRLLCHVFDVPSEEWRYRAWREMERR
jgi:transcriptional regulator with XRE-family HTH domain